MHPLEVLLNPGISSHKDRRQGARLYQTGSHRLCCLMTSCRALLDSYLLGNELPAPAVLHVSWRDGEHSARWKHPAVQVDFLHTVRELLLLPVRGAQLLPPRPPPLHAPSRLMPSWQGPPGRVRPLPDAIAPAAVAVEGVIERAAKQMHRLMAPKPGIQLSPGADFGIWPWASIQRTLYRQVRTPPAASRHPGKEPVGTLAAPAWRC